MGGGSVGGGPVENNDTYKGSTIAFWRDHVRRHHAAREAELRARLDEPARQLYDRALPIQWVDAPASARILVALADVLHPGDPQNLARLGRTEIAASLGGIYRVLLRVTTVPFAVRQCAAVWSTYHRRGQATAAIGTDNKSCTITVTGYPDLPAPLAHEVVGSVAGILEMVRAREPRVIGHFENPSAWRWEARWN